MGAPQDDLVALAETRPGCAGILLAILLVVAGVAWYIAFDAFLDLLRVL